MRQSLASLIELLTDLDAAYKELEPKAELIEFGISKLDRIGEQYEDVKALIAAHPDQIRLDEQKAQGG